eukprot:TRINITY_DN17356_c0_g3_i2.p2 TRINITY_DN17356_c0_g3~~TRINITY_DN17356_c0_g3_i2.p2  ORF type:complete len:237 (+),score=14.36 TRINITY_DN17356_c0_g3_i2:236-946(+)
MEASHWEVNGSRGAQLTEAAIGQNRGDQGAHLSGALPTPPLTAARRADSPDSCWSAAAGAPDGMTSSPGGTERTASPIRTEPLRCPHAALPATWSTGSQTPLACTLDADSQTPAPVTPVESQEKGSQTEGLHPAITICSASQTVAPPSCSVGCQTAVPSASIGCQGTPPAPEPGAQCAAARREPRRPGRRWAGPVRAARPGRGEGGRAPRRARRRQRGAPERKYVWASISEPDWSP